MLALESSSPVSCKTPVTFVSSIHPSNQPEKNKESRNEIKPPTNHIVLPWPSYTKPRFKRHRLGTQPKRGSNKINMLKQGKNIQKKASRMVKSGVTYGSQHEER